MEKPVTAPLERRIYKLPEVMAVCSISRSSIYRGMADGTFPKAIRLSQRSIGWRREEIDAWLANLEASAAPCADNDQYQTRGFLTSRPGTRERADA